MPRYFFDIEDGGSERDGEGTLCADDAEAWRQAAQSLVDILRDLGDGIEIGRDYGVRVRDETGAAVLGLRFSSERFR